MADQKKSEFPSALLNLAIDTMAEQQGGSLQRYGTAEHISIMRYLADEACKAAKCELSPQQFKAIREAFIAEADFLAYASNAKKKLEGAKLLTPAVEEYK